MMEPASLLPVAKFSCRKLVLVGDPRVCVILLVISIKQFYSTLVTSNVEITIFLFTRYNNVSFINCL